MPRSLSLFASVVIAGCIERPWQDAPARAQVDRTALQGVLLAAPPGDMVPVGAVFGDAIELAGYKLEPPWLVTGERSRLTFYWRCRAPLEAYHVFVHLDDPTAAAQRIHGDHDPARGRFPTDAWQPGDLVADGVTFTAGRTPLLLYVGFFSEGENRLPLTFAGSGRDAGHDRLLVGTLQLAR